MQAPAESFERPWLRFYDSGVPGSIHYPEVSLFDAFAASVRQRPKDVAWEFEGRRASYADTLAEVEACARALHGLGLRRGGRLLVASERLDKRFRRRIGFHLRWVVWAIGLFVLPLQGWPAIWHTVAWWVMGAAILLTVATGIDYVVSAVRGARQVDQRSD